MPRSRKPILRGTRVRMLFTVGKRRMYFAGTVRKVNGRCIYIRYDDGDRESVDIQSPRLKLLSTPATPSTPASTTTKRRKRSEETGETRNKSKRKAGQPPKRSAHYVCEGAKDNPIGSKSGLGDAQLALVSARPWHWRKTTRSGYSSQWLWRGGATSSAWKRR